MASKFQSLRDTLAAALGMTDAAIAADVPPPPPPVVLAPQTVVIPFDRSKTVCMTAQYASSRYERYQNALIWTKSAISETFFKTNLALGGTRVVLLYPRYGLLVNGVERASCVPAAGAVSGTFVGALLDEPDGIAHTKIVAYDAAGTLVENPAESLLEFWVIINRQGLAKDSTDVVRQNFSFEWTHPLPVDEGGSASRAVPTAYAYVKVRKAQQAPRIVPLPARVFAPFSTPISAKLLARVTYVPGIDNDMTSDRFPVLTKDGIEVSDHIMSYFGSADIIGPFPRLRLSDGARGQASGSMFTWLKVASRLGKVYAGDPWAAMVYDGTGTKRTLFGLRSRNNVGRYWKDVSQQKYSGDLSNNLTPTQLWSAIKDAYEIVGNWDSAIPEHERFPWESWGMAWDERTTAIDLNAPLVGGEPPHVTVLPDGTPSSGPVQFVTDRHGWVLRAQYSATNRDVPPIVTRFIKGNDPWGIACRDGIIYLGERGANKISKWGATTGAYLGDLIANANGAGWGAMDQNARVWRGPGGQLWTDAMRVQARSQNILAPEGIALMDEWLYWGSFALGEVRRTRITDGLTQACCRPNLTGNSFFMQITVSDGSFGPRHMIGTTTWEINHFGRPQLFLPQAGKAGDGRYASRVSGVDAAGKPVTVYDALDATGAVTGTFSMVGDAQAANGTPLTHGDWGYAVANPKTGVDFPRDRSEWSWQGNAYDVPLGAGGYWNSASYGSAIDISHGVLASGSAAKGLDIFCKADPAFDPTPDLARLARGAQKYRGKHYYLLHGPDGFGAVAGVPLPWGEDPDIDYALTYWGHTKP